MNTSPEQMRVYLRESVKQKLRVYRYGARTGNHVAIRLNARRKNGAGLFARFFLIAPRRSSMTTTLAWLLIISMNATGLSGVGHTAAYFVDTETSTGNTFVAGLVDFELVDHPFTPLSSALNLQPGTTTGKYIDVVPNPLTNPFQYYASSSNFSLDLAFCSDLVADMAVVPSSGTTTLFSDDPLPRLSSSVTTEIAPWYFSLSLPATSTIVNAVCAFDTDFNAWQTRHNFPEYDNGFSDTETISHKVYSWGLRLNKIYYDVDESEEREPKSCEARSPGYWVNKEGCTGSGNGSSNWTSQVNAFSSGFSEVFATTTGNQICKQESSTFCPSGAGYAAKLCRAKRHLLANELNIVSGKLDLDAIIAGSDNGSSAFDALGLTGISTVRDAIIKAEQIVKSSNSTTMLGYVATVMERIYTYYEKENPSAPMCVYETPTDPGRGHDPKNEWVEIYNQTNVPIDLNGFLLCDGDTCDVLSATTTVPAGGYAVVTGDASTWNYWNVPGNVVKIVLPDGTVGNELDDNADMLLLKRPDGMILDQMNYGTVTPSWPNANADLWDPGVPDVPQGQMLGRKPNGYDTNQPSDWHDFAPPYATLIYPTPYESGINWNWNTKYDITWLATNPNGSDTDLSIDLWYIEDTDFSTSMSTADRITPIVLGTQNDGVHTWTTPSGFIGWVWVKLVAKGPENPMINTTVASGRIYDPPAPINELWGETQTNIPEPTLTEEEMLELAGMTEGENATTTGEAAFDETATTTEETTTTTLPLVEEEEEEYATGITPTAPAVVEMDNATTTEEEVAIEDSVTGERATATTPEEAATLAEDAGTTTEETVSPEEETVTVEKEAPIDESSTSSEDPQTVVDESTVPAVREEDTQPEDPTPVETTEGSAPTDEPTPTESMIEPIPEPASVVESEPAPTPEPALAPAPESAPAPVE